MDTNQIIAAQAAFFISVVIISGGFWGNKNCIYNRHNKLFYTSDFKAPKKMNRRYYI